MPLSVNVPGMNICLFFLLVSIFYQACSDQVNYQDCGKLSASARILFGKDVQREEQPWMVSVISMYVVTSNRTHNVYCGGTLITSRFVLTAARCVTRNHYHGSKVYVHHEGVHLEEKPYIKARDVIVHPNYEWKTRKHNVALLRLAKRIDKGPESLPVCLMDKKTALLNKKVTVIASTQRFAPEDKPATQRASLRLQGEEPDFGTQPDRTRNRKDAATSTDRNSPKMWTPIILQQPRVSPTFNGSLG
ncbi:brain-specific serine protease 4-like [Amblyomma americanum]